MKKVTRCCKHWRLCGQHTQINRRVCRSPEDGWVLEMTRMATMADSQEGSTRESELLVNSSRQHRIPQK
ncbi:unnamed protein product [Ectocarpus sp. CCAP 1310/34]|nr:unnamed protein product [Ectocarpus sp. CCAP 1310/34]